MDVRSWRTPPHFRPPLQPLHSRHLILAYFCLSSIISTPLPYFTHTLFLNFKIKKKKSHPGNFNKVFVKSQLRLIQGTTHQHIKPKKQENYKLMEKIFLYLITHASNYTLSMTQCGPPQKNYIHFLQIQVHITLTKFI